MKIKINRNENRKITMKIIKEENDEIKNNNILTFYYGPYQNTNTLNHKNKLMFSFNRNNNKTKSIN